MKGKDLQKAIIEFGRTVGWRFAHFQSVPVKRGRAVVWMTPIAADGRGFPDLVAVRERCIVIEVKGDGDSLDADQRAWQSAFRMAGIEAFTWGPKDWGHNGTIETELLRRARRFPAVHETDTQAVGALGL